MYWNFLRIFALLLFQHKKEKKDMEIEKLHYYKDNFEFHNKAKY